LWFRKGAAQGNKECSYMLGCCRMFGYGGSRDLDSAKVFFTKALREGHHEVQALIEHSIIDSVKKHPLPTFASLTDVKTKRLPDKQMPLVTASTFDPDSLEGIWSGKLYTYDWSRAIVEREENMQLNLHTDGGALTGELFIDNKLAYNFLASESGKGWIILDTTGLERLTGIHVLRGFRCRVEQKGDGITLTGNLLRYDRQANEPYKPSCFILDKAIDAPAAVSALAADTTFVIKKVYPNPFTYQVTVDFTVLKADNIRFRICTLSGVVLYASRSAHYLPGEHSITLTPGVSVGNYRLEAEGRQFVWSRAIFRQ